MHGITAEDRGIVGFVKELGNTWHNFPQYVQIDGAVDFQKALDVGNYPVVKIPMGLIIPASMEGLKTMQGEIPLTEPNKNGERFPLMYSLVRVDTKKVVYNESVSEEYEVYQNEVFLHRIQEMILEEYPQVCIESAGTLFAGRIFFLNLILNRFQVTKDPSPQICRVMFYNAFGGRSISACMHFVRIVCNNTMRLAEAQGALNDTLKKFRHTSGAPGRVADHMVKIGKLEEIAKGRVEVLNRLSDISMNSADVDNFLEALIPSPNEKATGRAITLRQNKRNKIESLFDGTEDLQGVIKHTRYAMLQAVTAYSQFHTIPQDSTEVDTAFAWFDIATEGSKEGSRDGMNQRAFDILNKTDIPIPAKKKALMDAVGVN